MALLRVVASKLACNDVIEFMDQDDVWLPDKLARGVSALYSCDSGIPALYCARLMVVDADLRALAETKIYPHRCGFPASLIQNIAAGCTIVINRCAATSVARSSPPSTSPHDWWCYILVSAAGGRVLVLFRILQELQPQAGGTPAATSRFHSY